VDPSTFGFPIAALSVSRVNQNTRRSFSIAAWARPSVKWLLPVPSDIWGQAIGPGDRPGGDVEDIDARVGQHKASVLWWVLSVGSRHAS
jgi:hypothetical protein